MPFTNHADRGEALHGALTDRQVDIVLSALRAYTTPDADERDDLIARIADWQYLHAQAHYLDHDDPGAHEPD